MKKIILFTGKNLMVALIILFACIAMSVFAWLVSKKSADQWSAAATFSPSTPTLVLVPAQGWWTNISTPTPKSNFIP